jgi:uncharacterized membrane protein
MTYFPKPIAKRPAKERVEHEPTAADTRMVHNNLVCAVVAGALDATRDARHVGRRSVGANIASVHQVPTGKAERVCVERRSHPSFPSAFIHVPSQQMTSRLKPSRRACGWACGSDVAIAGLAELVSYDEPRDAEVQTRSRVETPANDEVRRMFLGVMKAS